MQDFEGKTAVITGGASGIGRALADRFAAARMNLVLADIEADALDKAVTALAERQTRVIGVVTNTMLRESIQELAQRAIAEFGNVHVLCNNAGVASTGSGGKPVWETPQSDWDDIVKGRVEQILARGGVATTDMTEVLRRRDAGEQF